MLLLQQYRWQHWTPCPPGNKWLELSVVFLFPKENCSPAQSLPPPPPITPRPSPLIYVTCQAAQATSALNAKVCVGAAVHLMFPLSGSLGLNNC